MTVRDCARLLSIGRDNSGEPQRRCVYLLQRLSRSFALPNTKPITFALGHLRFVIPFFCKCRQFGFEH